MPSLTPVREDTRIYECTLILSLQLTEKELTSTLQAIEQLFEEKGGKKLERDLWGRQGLAYPIKQQREGQYAVYLYELPMSAAQAIDAALLLEKPVLRHLLVKIPKHYEFISLAGRTAAWEKEKEELAREHEKEREEAVKQRIVQRSVKPAAAKSPPPAAAPQGEGTLDEKLGELISDEDLHL